jgi:hypothetical protein
MLKLNETLYYLISLLYIHTLNIKTENHINLSILYINKYFSDIIYIIKINEIRFTIFLKIIYIINNVSMHGTKPNILKYYFNQLISMILGIN